MSKAKLFFAQACPDTAPFVAELARLNVEYEEAEIQSSLSNLKQFLALRDSRSEFDNIKQRGGIGIPALVLDNDKIVLDVEKLADIFK
ncbi:hypothetical protein JP34_08480 [Gallibacterium anatis]|uniref:hypothetical protein n=1 Tax=Gallibacterium anatis TaxID=750 RepID=UPI000531C472|nr:hypothetical protein [Gallibacterium anatis]KGQ33219.1 hypothetical protein JP34_08480 [Gallibacterium anatis]